MQKITALLIDDELSSLQNLQHKLDEFCPNISIVAVSQKPEEAIELIRMHNPDVVFLDIEMPRMSGFRMLEKLGDMQPEIIFTTAYNHYAIDAIRISAFDYLTKPIAIAELQNAVSRLEERDRNMRTKERLDLLRHTVDDVQKTNDKIAVPTSDGIEFLPIKDIVRIESSGNYSYVCFVNGKKTIVTKLLKDFEEMLLPYRFFRIHHSHLINLDYIKKYIRGEGGQVLMQNEDIVDVSRRKKDEFLRLISV